MGIENLLKSSGLSALSFTNWSSRIQRSIGAMFIVWTLASMPFSRGVGALLCYDCDSFAISDCGPRFRPSHLLMPVVCGENVTRCGLQRQRAIPRIRQYAAIARTCYTPGSVTGLDSSVGCRTWTNSNNFTATYCFCDTDLCNGVSGIVTTVITAITMTLIPIFGFPVICS